LFIRGSFLESWSFPRSPQMRKECLGIHAPLARMTLDAAVGHLRALRKAADAIACTFEA
jgi:hypothetical protein